MGEHDEARRELAALLDERLDCSGPEALRLVRSLANAERIITQEYAERTLIELIQNARDAAREADLAEDDCEVLVWVGPRDGKNRGDVTVANRGVPITWQTVRSSLTLLGESTKTRDQRAGAIGHKGVGFKSVLELGPVVEVYSGVGEDGFAVQVRFDVTTARDRCARRCPDAWDGLAALGEQDRRSVEEMRADPPVFPSLYFPLPNYDDRASPGELRNHRGDVFDTWVRVPGADVSLIEGQFAALRSETLLLLGHAPRIRLDGPGIDGPKIKAVTLDADRERLGPRGSVSTATVFDKPERWLVFRREADPDVADPGEASELCVCVPLHPEATHQTLHLYFPTHIASGLPLLLHGFFKVDASRRHFASGGDFLDHNRSVQRALAAFVCETVWPTVFPDEGPREGVDPMRLIGAVAAVVVAHPPGEEIAEQLRDSILAGLAAVPCVPVLSGGLARPTDVLITRDHRGRTSDAAGDRREDELFDRVFEARDLAAVGLHRPAPPIHEDEGVLGLLSRSGFGRVLDDDLLVDLARARAAVETDPAWFSNLLRLLALRLRDRDEEDAAALIERLGAILPCRVGKEVQRVPFPLDGGDRVFFKVRGTRSTSPPVSVGFRFLDDAVMSVPSTSTGRAWQLDDDLVAFVKPHGLRPFVVDEVIRGIAESGYPPSDAAEVLAFVFDLLEGTTGELGLSRLSAWTPSASHPGALTEKDPRDSSSFGDRRRRRTHLGQMLLPCGEDDWQPAHRVLLGRAWSARHGHLLEEIHADLPAHWLASPERVRDELGLDEASMRRLAWRLGAWAGPRLVSTVNHAVGKAPLCQDLDPQWLQYLDEGGWCDFGGTDHEPHRVRALVDHDLAEPGVLDGSGEALRELLADYWDGFYAAMARGHLGCRQCAGRNNRGNHYAQSGRVDDGCSPSRFGWRLLTHPWFPVAWRDLQGGSERVAPTRVWFNTDLSSTGKRSRAPVNSRYQFVAVAADRRDDHLLRGLDAIDARRITPRQAVAELHRLRAAFESEDGALRAHLTRQPLAVSVFQTLHHALYEALAAEDVPDELFRDLPILVERGDALEYLGTGETAYYAGSSSAVDRSLFPEIALASLGADRKTLAARLSLETIEVIRRPVLRGKSAVTTAGVKLVLDEYLPLLLALPWRWLPPASKPVAPDSERFRRRVARYEDLWFVGTDDLLIEPCIQGTDIVAKAYGERQRDVLYDPRENIVYHDYPEGEYDALRPALAGALAEVLASEAYEDVFARVLALPVREARQFVASRNVRDPEDVEDVEAQIGSSSAERREEMDRLRRVFEAFVPTHAVDTWVQDAAVTQGVWMEQGGVDSLLGRLEAAGVDLSALDEALRNQGFGGVSVRTHARRFNAKRGQVRDSVVPVVVGRQVDIEPSEIRDSLAGLRVPDVRRRAIVDDEELLKPLAEWLRQWGLDQLVAQLFTANGPTRRGVLEALDITTAEFDRLSRQAWDDVERARIRRRDRQEQLERVRYAVAGLRLHTDGLPATRRRVMDLLSAARDATGGLSDFELSTDELVVRLTTRLSAFGEPGRLARVVTAAVTGDALSEDLVPTALVEQIRWVTREEAAQRAVELRRSMAQAARIRETEVPRPPGPPKQPRAPETPLATGAERDAPPGPAPVADDEGSDVGIFDLNAAGADTDHERKKRRGDHGERLVRGVLLQRLWQLDVRGFHEAIDAIDRALRSAFRDPKGDIFATKDRALAYIRDENADDEERLYWLAEYLDVSRWPSFGFDLLGWHADHGPLFVEVKTTKSPGTCFVTDNEWRKALREARGLGRYAVALLCGRDLDWLYDPTRQLDLQPNTYRATVIADRR